jgi:membrane-bound lytic murein transglycosylase MltF
VTLAGAVLLTAGGCSSPQSSPPAASSESRSTSSAGTTGTTGTTSVPPPSPSTPDDPPFARSPYDALPPAARALLDKPFTGDLDAMVGRRLIRAGVVFNRTQYFIDNGVQRGISYESIRLFEEAINKRLRTGPLKLYVAIVPLSRDQLFPALQAGEVDLVVATLTITPERRNLAAFSTPTRTGVSEIVVTAPGVPPLATADDLSGREVFVRRSSSYRDSLDRLNQSLVDRGKAPVVIKDVPEALEDDDVLEMVNAGLVDATVVDDFVADFWRQVFTNVTLHQGAAVRRDSEIAVAVRKNNPLLLHAVNVWIKDHGPHTAFGNLMQHQYLESADYVTSATAESERKKLLALVKLFETYGNRYHVDYLLVAAQGYQESRLDQSMRSRVGAIGIMQVMPATGRQLAVGDITKVEPNVHAGVKYFRLLMDQLFKDEPMDDLNRGLMTLASYDAGPERIRGLRQETVHRGLDPYVWFGNVERIVSERIGRETVQYVSNIFKYYVAYRLVLERKQVRDRANESVEKKGRRS